MVTLEKPWLLLPANLTHKLSHFYLKYYGAFVSCNVPRWSPFKWRGLNFTNPLGTAGGVDKNAEYISTLWSLGCGFIEVGTVTPKFQKTNPGCVVKRDNDRQALWNKLGFPNHGVKKIKERLRKSKGSRLTPIFVNIGKNRTTPNENAVQDYLYCINELQDEADAFVVNISSPNTTGLRELLNPKTLDAFLRPLVKAARGKPLLLKMSPDISDSLLRTTLDITLDAGVDGWILTNTTLDRKGTSGWPIDGGVSGLPLAKRSVDLLKLTLSHLGERRTGKLIISVGGVMTPADVFQRLELGADLVQVYTALIFNGPRFFKNTAIEAMP